MLPDFRVRQRDYLLEISRALTEALDLATRAIVFGAAGTCGQRCTTTRRVIVHESIFQALRDRLVSSYDSLPIGNPLDPGTLVGPLIDSGKVRAVRLP